MSEEYLTICEVSAFLKVKPKTVQNKISSGVFLKGVHYFRPEGMGPRFKRSAVIAWLERDNRESRGDSDSIPMPRSRGRAQLKIIA